MTKKISFVSLISLSLFFVCAKSALAYNHTPPATTINYNHQMPPAINYSNQYFRSTPTYTTTTVSQTRVTPNGSISYTAGFGPYGNGWSVQSTNNNPNTNIYVRVDSNASNKPINHSKNEDTKNKFLDFLPVLVIAKIFGF